MRTELVAQHTTFDACWQARDEAIALGLGAYAPDIVEPLKELGPALWPIVDALPTVGRVFFAAHLRMPRPSDPLMSGWHAVNCLREWRGDTHWALVASANLSGVEASVIHNAWLGYERDWLARSRGSSAEDIDVAWQSLSSKGLVVDNEVTPAAVALRQRIEDDTDRFTTLPWRQVGRERALAFARDFEPPCEKLLARVDLTAGPNYQPASRIR
jgi:helix-turn-helix protein